MNSALLTKLGINTFRWRICFFLLFLQKKKKVNDMEFEVIHIATRDLRPICGEVEGLPLLDGTETIKIN